MRTTSFRNLSIITKACRWRTPEDRDCLAPRHRHAEHRRDALHRAPDDGGADGVPAGVEEDVRETHTGLTSNYTATWESWPTRDRSSAVFQYQQWIPYFHHAGEEGREAPLPLLRNAQILGRKYSLGFYGG